MRFPERLLSDPSFFGLPESEQISRVSQEVPEFGSAPIERQRKVLQGAAAMARPRVGQNAGQSAGPSPAPPPSPVGAPPSDETFGQRVSRDLSTGFQSGMADLGQGVSSVAGMVGATGVAKQAEDWAKSVAPPPQATQGTILDQVLQGAGAAPATIIKYAPTQLAGKYAPLAAGVIGAATHAKEGWRKAIKEGVKDATMFAGMGKASQLPTRLQRTAANAAIGGATTAAFEGGDPRQITSSAILGGAFGAMDSGEGVAAAKKPGEAKPGTLTEGQARALLDGGVEAVSAVRDNLRQVFAPQNRGPQARKMAEITRAHTADVQRQSDIADHALEEASKSFRYMPDDQRLGIIDRIEKGQKIEPGEVIAGAATHPKMQQFIDTMREIHNGVRDELINEASVQDPKTGEMKPTALKTVVEALKNPDAVEQAYYENYFPHLFKNPKRAEEIFRGFYAGKRKLEGPATFLRQRKHPTLEDAMWEKDPTSGEFLVDDGGQRVPTGLELITTDPVEANMLKWREMKRFTASIRIMKEMGESNLIEWERPGKRGPEGWVKIEDRSFAKRNPDGEDVAYAWAPAPAAQVLNNYLSPGLRGDKGPIGAGFRGVMQMNNVLNQAQLGFSAYHLGFTSVDAVVSKFALGLEQSLEGLRTGDVKMAAKGAVNVAKATPVGAPLTLIENIARGNKLLQEWRKPGSTNPEVASMVQAMQDAGGGIGLDPIYKTNMIQKVRETFRQQEGYWKLAYRLPLAVNEMAGKLILEQFVPRQKLGVFADLARFEMDRLPEGATPQQRREAYQKAWDSVDNRMGQLRYDNLFWNKMAKDIAMASMRSVGWNLGTWRELGGAGFDTAAAAGTLAKRVTGQPVAGRPEFTHRMAYAVALPAVAGMMGSLTNYLYTGEGPKDLMDMYFPRTGRLDEFGRPERLSIPSYIKDLYHIGVAAKDVATGVGSKKAIALAQSKIHSSWGVVADMLANHDYYNTEISNETDPFMKRTLDRAKFIAEQFTPFAWTTMAKQRKQGTPTGEMVGSFFGMVPAPADIKKTVAERMAGDIMEGELRRRPKTQEEAARQDQRRELERLIRAKDSSWQNLAAQSLENETLGIDDIMMAAQRAGSLPLDRTVKRLPLEDAMRIWGVADNAEKQRLRPVIMEKVDSSMDKLMGLPKPRQQKIFKEVWAILNEPIPAAPPRR